MKQDRVKLVVVGEVRSVVGDVAILYWTVMVYKCLLAKPEVPIHFLKEWRVIQNVLHASSNASSSPSSICGGIFMKGVELFQNEKD